MNDEAGEVKHQRPLVEAKVIGFGETCPFSKKKKSIKRFL